MLRFLAFCSFLALVACDGTRVEFLLSDLKNDQGILTTGKRCDGRGSTRKCDTVITASIDTDTPTKAWPGYKPTSQWTKVLEADERESMAVNKIISKDICSGSSRSSSGSRSSSSAGRSRTTTFDKANLRVLVADKDPGNKFSPIEQFECMSGREVATRRTSSDWSTVQPCKAKFNPTKVKLNYQWRAYPISNSECDQPVTDDQPTYGRRTYYN